MACRRIGLVIGIGLLVPALGAVACDGKQGPLFRSAEEELEPLPVIGGGGTASTDPTPDADVPEPSGGTGGGGGALGGAGGTGGGGDPPSRDAGNDAADALPGVDPDLPPSDGSCQEQCVRNGGRCDDGACIFDCTTPDSCAVGQVRCPPGEPCEVRCGTRACVDNVICGPLAECQILCEGELSCAREVICEGSCDVVCSGARSCRGGVGGSVELMTLECTGLQACGGTVSCEGTECQLECTGPQTCPRVRTFAQRNRLTCSGAGSCDLEITCLGGSCRVDCDEDACSAGVDCQAEDCSDIDLDD